MSDPTPLYVLHTEQFPGIEPPGFDSHPAPERGYMTPAAEVVALRQQLAALTMRADCATRATCVAWATEDVQAENRLLTVAVAELTARALKAEARVKSQQGEAETVRKGYLLNEQSNAEDAARELSHERQMRQQTEEAMLKLAARVKSQQDERATATPAWINMADRFPEDPSYCLVVDENHRVHELEFNGGHWWTYQADGPMPPVAFSHWMPTPAAPQAAPAALTWPCPGCLATSPKECLASTNACVFRPAP